MVASPSSIAVLRMSALGDVVMTLPLVRTLQQAFPHAKLYWIVSRPFHAIVEGLPGVELIVIDKPGGPVSWWRLRRQLRQYDFDWLLVPQASMRANLVTLATRARRKVGFGALHSRDLQRWFVHETARAEPEHLVDRFLRFAEHVGARERVLDCSLPLRAEECARARETLAGCAGLKLAVVLAASKAERSWPLERYRDVLNRLAARRACTVVLVGSAAERALAASLREGLQAPVLDLVGKTDLRQLAAILGEADALLAPDSGPVHVARAMDTSVVGLYAVAPAARTGPYLAAASTVDRFEQAGARFGRAAGQRAGRERVHDARAMQLIEVDDVLAKLVALHPDL